jgi:hypothetical protein
MKLSIFTLSILGAVSLHAQTQDVPWNQLCRYADGRPIEVTTAAGDTFTGFCASVTDKELSIRRPGQAMAKIARTGLAKLQVEKSRGSQTKLLGRQFRGAMRHALRTLGSPRGVAGLIEVPVVAAWGATALPFCLIADIGYEPGSVEVRPI